MPITANNVPAQAYLGLAIRWGIGPTDYTVTNASMLVQSSDNEMTYDNAELRDQRGNVKAVAFYNPHDQATVEYVVITSGSFDAGTSSVTYPTQGAMITIGSDAGDPISGSNWIVQSNMVRSSNTDACKVQLKVVRYGGVTQ